jgi:outer membrane protein assembly factor BamE (lipoprotein component of BamABCDE complex)
VPPDAELEQILVGVDTRGTIEETIGRPSAAAGVLREEAWIYSAYRVRNYTYQAPEVIERDVVAISFDAGWRGHEYRTVRAGGRPTRATLAARDRKFRA